MKKTYIIHPHTPPPEREPITFMNFHKLPYAERLALYRGEGREMYEYIRMMNETYRSEHERK